MKIGILTFHRAYNYGAVLQCYALQQVLTAMGHKVMVIDYRQPWIEEGYKAFSWSTLAKKQGLHMKLRYLRWAPKRWWNNERLQKPHFRGFCKHYLNLTKPCTADTIPADFDCYIIGSDQLWNMGCTANKPDKAYFGLFDHPQQSFLVGYAIGAHPHSLVQLGSDYLTKATDKFRCLSFREPNIAEQMAHMTGRAFASCIDPTLLTDAAMWHNLTNDKYSTRQYILAYGVRKPAGQPNYLRQKAEEMARLTGWEVIDVSNMQLSVADFLSLFRHARYVLAMSFHAVAFSLIFRRPFYAICLNDGHDERYANLLRMIEADKQLVSLDFTPEPRPLDYEPIAGKLYEYRGQSIKFLRNALAGHPSITPTIMPEIRFVSFASSNMRPSLDRIRREALASGFFDTIHTYTEHDLEPWYRRQYADRFRRYKRGYGYWIWKSHIIKNELDSLKPDDILVYLDAGCTINGEGYDRFRQYVDYTRLTDVGIVAFEQKHLLEKHWTRADLLAHCGALDDSSITDSGQLWAGAHLTRKTPRAEEFVGRWHDLCHNHFNLITDEPSALPNLPGFRENRHDQSAYSVLLKPYGPYIVDSDETCSYNDDYASDLPDKPFWATRRRQMTW